MCLILLAIDSHPQFPLVVAANRDEYYARPTQPLQPWPEAPQLLAGKDLTAGGTWLGLTRAGRFAAVTNARGGRAAPQQARSRGRLTLDFLLSDEPAADYVDRITRDGDYYAGFNLLVSDRSGFYFCSNGDKPSRRLQPGIYGVANASLDTPWPKVESGKAELREQLEQTPDPHRLLKILAASQGATTDPVTNVDAAMTEYLQTSSFISSATYGTRASTVLLIDRDGVAKVWEQSFGNNGVTGELVRYEWQLDPVST